jgi:hypothetical protein
VIAGTSSKVMTFWVDPRQTSGVYTSNLRAMTFDKSGTAVASRLLLATWPGENPPYNRPSAASLTTGKAVVAWCGASQNGCLRYAIFAADGTREGFVRTVPGAEPSDQNFAETNPVVAPLQDGGFMLFYMDGPQVEVFAQRFDKTGKAVGTRKSVLIKGGIASYSAALLSNGNVMLAGSWYTSSGSGDEDVHVIIVSPNGTVVGTEKNIGANKGFGFGNPRVASFAQGGAVLVWDAGTANQAFDVVGRLLTNSGGPASWTFTVNSLSGNHPQSNPSVATFGNRRFVVGWQGTVFGGSALGALPNQAGKRLFDASAITFGP